MLATSEWKREDNMRVFTANRVQATRHMLSGMFNLLAWAVSSEVPDVECVIRSLCEEQVLDSYTNFECPTDRRLWYLRRLMTRVNSSRLFSVICPYMLMHTHLAAAMERS